MKNWTKGIFAAGIMAAAMFQSASAETIKVGSKNFTEQFILAEMYAAVLEMPASPSSARSISAAR